MVRFAKIWFRLVRIGSLVSPPRTQEDNTVMADFLRSVSMPGLLYSMGYVKLDLVWFGQVTLGLVRLGLVRLGLVGFG